MNLILAKIDLETDDGSDSPPLLSAMTRNSYSLPADICLATRKLKNKKGKIFEMNAQTTSVKSCEVKNVLNLSTF